MALHPDGKTLVFIRDGKTWVGDTEGGTPKELANAPDSACRLLTAFSPDGSKLAVAD